MKKARIVEIPDGVLDESTYVDLKNHAVNSSIWYSQRYPCHSSKLKRRLYEKGYPSDSVLYRNENDEEIEVNIVDEVIEYLKELLYVDDERFLHNKIESEIYKGKGLSFVKQKLFQTGASVEEIEKAIDEMNDDDLQEEIYESLEKAFKKISRSSKYRKADNEFKRKMIIRSGLFQKGFDSSDIDEYLDELDDDFWEE